MSSHIIEYKTAQNIKQLYDNDDDDEALLHEGRNIPWWRSEQKKNLSFAFRSSTKKARKIVYTEKYNYFIFIVVISDDERSCLKKTFSFLVYVLDFIVPSRERE